MICIKCGHVHQAPQPLDPEIIIQYVCDYYKQPRNRVISNLRFREYVIPRQIISHLLKMFTRLSLTKIGTYYIHKDHTTILNHLKVVNDLMETDFEYRRNVEYLVSYFKTYSDMEISVAEVEDELLKTA